MRDLKKGKKKPGDTSVIALDELAPGTGDSHKYSIGNGKSGSECADLAVLTVGAGCTVADLLLVCADELAKRNEPLARQFVATAIKCLKPDPAPEPEPEPEPDEE